MPMVFILISMMAPDVIELEAVHFVESPVAEQEELVEADDGADLSASALSLSQSGYAAVCCRPVGRTVAPGSLSLTSSLT